MSLDNVIDIVLYQRAFFCVYFNEITRRVCVYLHLLILFAFTGYGNWLGVMNTPCWKSYLNLSLCLMDDIFQVYDWNHCILFLPLVLCSYLTNKLYTQGPDLTYPWFVVWRSPWGWVLCPLWRVCVGPICSSHFGPMVLIAVQFLVFSTDVDVYDMNPYPFDTVLRNALEITMSLCITDRELWYASNVLF